MDTPHQESLPTESSARSASHQRAEDNMVLCLEALDRDGNRGLQAALYQIYPPEAALSDHRPIPLHTPLLDTPIQGVRRATPKA